MAKVLSIATSKGGTGKSTSTVEIATILKLRGNRVLVIDLDENRTLSKNVDADLSTQKNIYNIFDGQFTIEECIQHLELFDIIPASKSLSKANVEFTDRDDVFLLSDICNEIADDYDFIFIDNAPSRSILLTMTYVACDYVVVPTLCDEGSLDLLDETEADIEKLTSGRMKESHAKVIGYILSKYKISNVNDIAIQRLQDNIEENNKDMFCCKVSDTVRMSEIKTYKTSICLYEKSNPTVKEYEHIVDEILERVGA